MPPPMIAGLFPYTRGGVTRPPVYTLSEIPASLAVNPSYRRDLTVLAGDSASATQLRALGIEPVRVFDDAPAYVHRDTAHKMKHWMCRWALATYGEFLWVDWDTVLLRPLDDAFWRWAREHETPKFIRIPNYWATVNCGVYYASARWAEAMDRSFEADVSEPNDELLWRSVLPSDVVERDEFWWGPRAVNIWTEDEVSRVTRDTYFAHTKTLGWADALRDAAARAADAR